MENKNIIIGVIIAIILVAGIYLLSRGGSPEAAQLDSPSVDESALTETTKTATNGAVKEFTITGSNYKFSPATMNVNAGDTVKITLKSSGGNHDLVIDGLNVATKELGNGESDTVEFVADKAGTYEFYCSISNHRQMGMTGTLTVN